MPNRPPSQAFAHQHRCRVEFHNHPDFISRHQPATRQRPLPPHRFIF
jgi:hypothetical protein